MARTLTFATVIAVGLGGAWAASKYYAQKAGPPARTAPPPQTNVVALGRVQPLKGVIAVGGDTGRQISELLVSEGAEVRKGALLARLDNYPSMEASRVYADSQYRAGREQLEAKIAAAQASIAQANADLASAEETAPLEIKSQQAKIDKVNQQITEAKSEINRMTGLAQSGATARIDLDRKQSDLRGLESDLQVAQAELANKQSAQRTKKLKAQADLATAKSNLQLAHATVDVTSLQNNLKLAESHVEDTLVRAPVDGVILKIYRRPGESLSSDPILRMADLTEMVALTEVYETDVHLVSSGQLATVTAPALPTPLTGVVSGIGRLIVKQGIYSNDPSAPTDARVVEVVVRLDNPQTVNRLVNLQVQVNIKVREVEKSGTQPASAPATTPRKTKSGTEK